MQKNILTITALLFLTSPFCYAQFPFDPPSADYYNGIVMPTGAGSTMAININFSDTTLWAIAPSEHSHSPPHQYSYSMHSSDTWHNNIQSLSTT
jgi:hypothetical protein